jgi:hypothetical protein
LRAAKAAAHGVAARLYLDDLLALDSKESKDAQADNQPHVAEAPPRAPARASKRLRAAGSPAPLAKSARGRPRANAPPVLSAPRGSATAKRTAATQAAGCAKRLKSAGDAAVHDLLSAFEMTPMDLNNLTVRLAPAQCQQLVGLLIAINRLPPSDLAVHRDIVREFAKYTATAGDVVSTDVSELLAQKLRRPPCLDTQARVQAAIERAAKNWPAATQGTRDGLLSSLVGALRSAPVKGTTIAVRVSKKTSLRIFQDGAKKYTTLRRCLESLTAQLQDGQELAVGVDSSSYFHTLKLNSDAESLALAYIA